MARFDWERIMLGHNALLLARKSANAESHTQAFHTPRAGFESAIVGVFNGLAEYAAAHAKAYGSDLADDGVLGEAWKDAAKAALAMLNGDCGRLDCGTLDSALRELAELAGFDADVW